jgi:hypothetical protein
MASFSWASLLRITIFLLLVAAAVFAFFTLPVEKVSIFLLPFLSLSFLFSFVSDGASFDVGFFVFALDLWGFFDTWRIGFF